MDSSDSVGQRSSNRPPSQTPSPPLNKRRRLSFSSLSHSETDDDEDEPLAVRVVSKAPRQPVRRGKFTFKSRTAPSTFHASVSEESHGQNGPNGNEQLEVPEKMNDSQLDLIATGVTMDSGNEVMKPMHLNVS